MNINKAIDHFTWKFKNTWKPTKKDIEAFNSILDWKELQESKAIQENELLAKLWIEKLILLNESNLYSAERSIQVIDEILKQNVYDWVLKLKDKINIMRFNALSSNERHKDTSELMKRSKTLEKTSKIVNKKQKELREEITAEISEEKIIKFVEQQINRIINKYEK